MAVFTRLISVIAAAALAMTFIGLGFVACVLPPATHNLANTYANDTLSPFDRTQLVQVADATRDYAFGSHDELALYRTIYDVNAAYAQSIEEKGGQLGADFPDLADITEASHATAYRSVFTHASDIYCYTPEEIAHLDDCHALALRAYPAIGLCALVAVAGLAFVGFKGRKRLLGGVFMAAGIAVVALFAAVGLWAVFDFAGVFNVFHQLLFTQGNWTFPADSLLICALPEAFWAGMAGIWIGVSAVLALASLLIGRLLRGRLLRGRRKKA